MNLIQQFQSYVKSSISEEGVFPFPGMALNRSDTTEIAAICEAETAMRWFWENVTNPEIKECIFGLDRTTREGQGTEFADVLTCAYWSEEMGGDFVVGVINYQPDPKTLREIDFENQFWIEQMADEVNRFRPPFLAKVVKS